MPLFSLLTRLLLIASLVLNGSGYALAADAGMAMQAHADHAMGEETVRSDTIAMHDGEAPPCHDMMSEDGISSDMAGMQPADPSDVADCCKAGSCLHECHQQLAPAANTVAFLPAAIVVSQHVEQAPTSAHDAPALHRLIRPPIA